MQYSLKQCKDDMLLLWGYLKEHPEVNNKYVALKNLLEVDEISYEDFSRFVDMTHFCPCCEYDREAQPNRTIENYCPTCPIWGDRKYKCFVIKTIGPCIISIGEYAKWTRSWTKYGRRKWATRIYKMAEAIEV